MRLRELRGLPVIDPTAARKIGTVVDYQVDPTSGRLAALDVSAGQDSGASASRVPAQHIRRVGRDAVMLTGRAAALGRQPADVDERWLDGSSLVGLEVVGDDGNRVGQLADALFNQDSLEIEAYLLRASPWQQLLGHRDRIEAQKVHSCSRELMVISSGRVSEPAAAQPEAPTPPLSVPLKEEDRLPVPEAPAPDGHAVRTT